MQIAVRLAALFALVLAWAMLVWPVEEVSGLGTVSCAVPGFQVFSDSTDEEDQACIELGKRRMAAAGFMAAPAIVALIADLIVGLANRADLERD